MMELESEKLLKHVLVGTSIKRWTKAVCWKHQRTGQDGTVSVVVMKVVRDVDTRAFGRGGWFWYADNHLASLILIKVFVVSTIAQRVFRSVEWLPDVQSNLTWARTRRSLQNDWFGNRRAGWMYSSNNRAAVCNCVSYLGVRNFPQQYYPVCSLKTSNEHFNATAIMVLNDYGNNNW